MYYPSEVRQGAMTGGGAALCRLQEWKQGCK